MGGPWLLLGRASSPPALLAAGSREIGGPLGGGVATPGPKQDGGAFSKSLPPTPTVLGGPEPPHPGSPRALRPQRWSPKRCRQLLGPRRGGKEATAAPGSHALLARPTSPALPCTHACLMPRPSLSPSLLGIQMVSTVAPPPQSGARGQGGTRPPHRCPPAPKPPCLRPGVCPRLLSASPLGRLAPCRLVHPAASSLVSD